MSIGLEKQVSDTGLAYHRCGDGPTLVLIHGVGLCAESWHPQINALNTQFEILVPDLPQHGKSNPLQATFEESSLLHYTKAMADFIDDIGCSEVILCGHSLGALIAIELASQLDQQASGLLALNTIYNRSEQALLAVQQRANDLYQSDSVIGVDHTLQRWFGPEPSSQYQQHRDNCRTWLENNSVEGYAKAYKAFANESGARNESLAGISCPTIFMTGSDDPNSTTQMTHALAEHMTGDGRKHLVKAITVANSGHMMPLTHQAHVCKQIINLNSII